MKIASKPNVSPARPRGRPRKFDCDAVVTTALGLFQERGYEGTSIADLTEAIGISAKSLYGVFPSKEALFEAAVELYQETQGAFAAHCLASGDTALQAVTSLLRQAAHEYAVTKGCFVSLGVLSCSLEHEALAARMAARRVAARQAIAERLEKGRMAGELEPGTDVHAFAGLIAASLQGMSVQARDGADETELLAIARLALVPLQARCAKG